MGVVLPIVCQLAGSSHDVNARDTTSLIKVVRRGMVTVEGSAEFVARLVFLLKQDIGGVGVMCGVS